MSIDTKPFDWRAHLKVHPAAELFPLMSQDELQALAEDILKNGLRQNIIFCGDPVRGLDGCQLIDGRNRLDALALLGFVGVTDDGGLIVTKSCTKNGEWVSSTHQPFSYYLKGEDPYTLALSHNVHRRHLSPELRRRAIDAMLKLDPNKSDRQIAEATHSSPTTVGTRRKKAEEAGDVSKLDTRKDKRGRKQPAKKAKPAASTTTTKAPVNPRDIALESFDAHVLELLRIIKGQKPERFAKTAVPLPVLGDLAYFIRELMSVRKLANEGADHDASASAEQRKADYAASEVADKDLNIPD
jgi:DNA-binding Lrp family transcriptional regulator